MGSFREIKMPYTTIQRVQRRAGVQLTAAQMEEAALLIPVAEAFIDQRTGTTWRTTPGVVSETQTAYSHEIQLRQPPVDRIDLVQIRRGVPGSQVFQLSQDEYELFDPRLGILLIPRFWRGGRGNWNVVTINYWRASDGEGLSIDPRISLAATDLVLWWMQPQAGGQAVAGGEGLPAGEIKSYSVGGDLQVTFADGGKWGKETRFGIPDNIVAIVDSLKRVHSSFA